MIKDVSDRAKHCPLCGGKDVYIEVGEIDTIYTMYIICPNCGLKGFKNFFKSVSIDEGETRLIEYWNTRKGDEE